MMAYDSQFVVCILHNRNVLRESNNGTVYIPFDSEYKIRLKNKHGYLRAKAKVFVDGRPASNMGDFILSPGETLDLERFLDHSMTKGRKFKFVPVDDHRVADPTDSENGIIKVEFYREIDYVRNWNPRPWPITPRFGSSTGTAGSPISDTIRTCYINNNTTLNSSIVSDSFVESNTGATIEGGSSGQSFSYSSDFPTDSYPITLTLRLRGTDVDERPRRQRKPKKRIKFCPNCGARRHGMAKFCASCGTAYHPRYERERGRLVR
jgi:hypothetical protein